jgi:hypothetical protein
MSLRYAIAMLLLAGCDADVISVCHSCLKGDPAAPVAKAELAKIGLVYSGRRLPPSATNIYYAEECGIDCQQWIRFDAPMADARAFATSLLLTPPAKTDAKEPPFLSPSKPLAWWPTNLPADAMVSTNHISTAKYGKYEKGQPLTIILQPGAPSARVWIYAYTM